MARPETKKNISGDIPEQLHADLIQWIEEHKNQKITPCLQTMIELWLAIPDRLQGLLMISKRDSIIFQETAHVINGNTICTDDIITADVKDASDCMRRLLCLLQDYANTTTGISTIRELRVALDATCDLFRVVHLEDMDGLTDAEREVTMNVFKLLQEHSEYTILGHAYSDKKSAKKAVRQAGRKVLKAKQSKKKPRKTGES